MTSVELTQIYDLMEKYTKHSRSVLYHEEHARDEQALADAARQKLEPMLKALMFEWNGMEMLADVSRKTRIREDEPVPTGMPGLP